MRLSKCFSMKFRTLLGNRMLHSNICFRLQATYNLHTSPNMPVRPWYLMGNAFGCSLRLNPFLNETHRLKYHLLPAGALTLVSKYTAGWVTHDAATLVTLLNHQFCMVCTVTGGGCHAPFPESPRFIAPCSVFQLSNKPVDSRRS